MFFHSLYRFGSSKVLDASMGLELYVVQAILKAVHLPRRPCLFVSKAAIVMHLCSKPIVLGPYYGVVHPCTAQVVGVEGEEVIEGIPPSRVHLLISDPGRRLCLMVVDRPSWPGEAESDASSSLCLHLDTRRCRLLAVGC